VTLEIQQINRKYVNSSHPDCVGHVFQLSDHVSVRAVRITLEGSRDGLDPAGGILPKSFL
jgi:hypothetical protein